MYSRVVFGHSQYMAQASFDAPPASGAVTRINADDFVPAHPLSVQVTGKPQ
jgi:hypothetical protein